MFARPARQGVIEGGKVRSHDGARWLVEVSSDLSSCGRDTPYQTWLFRVELGP